MSVLDMSKGHPWAVLVNQDNVLVRVHDRWMSTTSILGKEDDPLEIEFEVVDAERSEGKSGHISRFSVTAEEWKEIRAAVDACIEAAEKRAEEERAKRPKSA